MKVKRDTPTQLIVENNPIWLAVMVSVFGLVFFGVGMSAFREEPTTGALFMGAGLTVAIGCNMIFVRRTQLILDAGRNLIELRRRGWLKYVVQSWELRYFDRAIVQVSRGDKTDTYRAALVINGGMDAGTHPVTLVYSSGRGAKRAVKAINSWHAALDSATTTA